MHFFVVFGRYCHWRLEGRIKPGLRWHRCDVCPERDGDLGARSRRVSGSWHMRFCLLRDTAGAVDGIGYQYSNPKTECRVSTAHGFCVSIQNGRPAPGVSLDAVGCRPLTLPSLMWRWILRLYHRGMSLREVDVSDDQRAGRNLDSSGLRFGRPDGRDYAATQALLITKRG